MKLLSLEEYINLIVRGAATASSVYIQKKHEDYQFSANSDGVCQIYIDSSADQKKALDICLDFKGSILLSLQRRRYNTHP